ncbi:DUF3177 family protein [Acaryochloris marina]|uniref:DUF3177 domain-containing protein n=1 Tax=Acaryochloris marina (strain MBIC 11017) TaxID=329726 RepID=B0CEX8_ACAM1|nr:DUF3177 family protein [Acaryochloris marina]ABW29375.1 conserved hypothetical protein [Acaryochloris marina MBIC11017]BDM78292.1 hypothetical protein AM10699_11620 [Acaryochloris marina MBIC10699]
MSIEMLRTLVWTDCRLALVFLVFFPFGLLVWAIIENAQPISRLLVIYWRVASLLLITMYLMMAQVPLSFVTLFLALLLVPASLWFWVDLNEEIDDRRGKLKLALTSWRWATTLFCLISAAALSPSLGCAGSKTAIETEQCQVWLEPAYGFSSIVHASSGVSRINILATLALILYSFYFGYFLLFRLSKQGRSATGY